MNLKNLFKALFALLLVVAFAACDRPVLPSGDMSYTIKYNGKTVKSNDVIVVTMDDYDDASKEMSAEIEIINGEVKNNFDIYETRKFNVNKFTSSVVVGDTLLAESNSASEQIWELGEVAPKETRAVSFRLKTLNDNVRTVCETEYMVTNGRDSLDVTFTVKFVYKQSKQLEDGDKEMVKLLGNCKSSGMNDALVFGYGDGKTHTFGGATLLSVENLINAGCYVAGIRVYVGNEVKTGKVFIGTDYQKPEIEKTFTYTKGGWQYIMFDELYDFKQDTYIGYIATGTTDFMACEKSSKTSKTEMIYVENGWDLVSNQLGKYVWSIQAIMVGGDYSKERQHDVLLERGAISQTLKVGDPVVVSCELRNAGVTPAENVVVKCTLGGEEKTVTVSDRLLNGQSYMVNIDGFSAPAIEGAFKDVAVEIVAEYADDVVSTNNNEDLIFTVFSADAFERQSVYIEQFTGQGCPNCPNGTKTMAAAIAGMKDPSKAVWVAHHTYGTDAFTLNESLYIADYLGVNAAPMCNINRMACDYGAGQSVLIWHPGYATSAILEKNLLTPALSTIELNRTFNVEDSTLTVEVKGNSIVDEVYVTVIVTQSGLNASQSGVTGTYTHNNAPRKFLTSQIGELMTLEGGSYSKSYTYKVPAKIGGSKGTFDCVFENMEIVAVVHGKITNTTNRMVHNAVKLPLLETQTQNVMRAVSLYRTESNYELRSLAEQICY